MKKAARRQKRANRERILPRLGGELGRVAGTAAQYFFDKITGRGAYTVRKNEVLTDTGPPQFSSTGDGLVVSHREFITNISGNSTFVIPFRQALNPGNAELNPWASGIAQMFEEWRALGWVISTKPTTGMAVASTNAAMGVVVIATDYDVLNPPFASRQEMEAYEFSTSAVSYQPQTHPIECEMKRNVMGNLFVRSSGEIPSGSDSRFYDLGMLNIGVEGQQSTNVITEVWGSYKFQFRKPRLPLYNTPSYTHFTANPAGSAAFGFLGGTSGLLATARSNLRGVIAGVLLDGSLPTFFLTRPGSYLIMFWCGGTAMVNPPTLTTGANITASVPWFANFTSPSLQLIQTSISQGVYFIVVNVNTSGSTAANKVTLGGGTGLTAGNSDVLVFPVPTAPAGLGLEEKVRAIMQKLAMDEFAVVERKVDPLACSSFLL